MACVAPTSIGWVTTFSRYLPVPGKWESVEDSLMVMPPANQLSLNATMQGRSELSAMTLLLYSSS